MSIVRVSQIFTNNSLCIHPTSRRSLRTLCVKNHSFLGKTLDVVILGVGSNRIWNDAFQGSFVKHNVWSGGVQTRSVRVFCAESGQESVRISLVDISVVELSEILANPDEVAETQFVDVREDWEHQMSSLPHFELKPLSQIQEWAPDVKTDLDPSKKTVVLCHHGVRSYNVATFLVQQGFENVFNVAGGIDAYSCNVDGSVPRY